MNTKEFIYDLIIAGIFIAMGILAPGSTLLSASGFMANLTGIATGVGLGWLIKSFMENRTRARTADE